MTTELLLTPPPSFRRCPQVTPHEHPGSLVGLDNYTLEEMWGQRGQQDRGHSGYRGEVRRGHRQWRRTA